MKKRSLLVFASLMIAALMMLTACGSSKEPETSGNDSSDQGGKLVFLYKDMEIAMKEDAAPILEALGEPKSYTEAASCAFEGLDKTYYYGSFYLYTYPDGEKDRVNMVVLCDDTLSTPEGLAIGDSKEKVESTYGADGYNGVNAYVYAKGDCTLTIIMENDKVSSIQYGAVFES